MPRSLAGLSLLGILVSYLVGAGAPLQAAEQRQAAVPTLVTVMSGPSGEVRDGRYYIHAPRTRFRVPEDTKVVVHFEWVGAPGTYKLSGTWRGPNNTSTTSEFEYTARDKRFAAYWELPLSPQMPLGDWTLEARIDGVLAGSHQFQVLGMDADPAPPVAPRRLPLERRDAYSRALALTARVEAVAADGSRLDEGAGTLLDGDLVVTSFSRVNNAARVRITAGKGPATEIGEAVAFNRRQDWILFRVPGIAAAASPVRAIGPPQPGDACYSANVSSDGAVTAAAGEVAGATRHAVAGERVLLSFVAGFGSPGAPVVDEFGDIAGMVAAGMLPGVPDHLLTAFRPGAVHTPVVPIGLVPGPDSPLSPTPLSALAERGLFTPPVTATRHVMSGGFATGMLGSGASIRPIDQRTHFSAQDPTITVFVNWLAAESFKSTTVLRLYDIDNRPRGEAKVVKLTPKKGDVVVSSWQMQRPPAGVYRADVLLGTDIAWRGYFVVE